MTKTKNNSQPNHQPPKGVEEIIQELGHGLTELWTNVSVAVCDITAIMNVLIDKNLVSSLEFKTARAKILAQKRAKVPANIMELATAYILPESDKEYIDLLSEEFGIDVEKMHAKAKELGEKNANPSN